MVFTYVEMGKIDSAVYLIPFLKTFFFSLMLKELSGTLEVKKPKVQPIAHSESLSDPEHIYTKGETFSVCWDTYKVILLSSTYSSSLSEQNLFLDACTETMPKAMDVHVRFQKTGFGFL